MYSILQDFRAIDTVKQILLNMHSLPTFQKRNNFGNTIRHGQLSQGK